MKELASLPWPTIASEALYGLPGKIVRSIDPFTEADPAAVLIHVLTAFGNIIGPGAHAAVQNDLHPARIFAVIVGASSKGRKGTSWSTPKELFSRIDSHWSDCRIRSGLSSGEGLIYHVRDPRKKSVPVRQKGRIIDYEQEAAVLCRVGIFQHAQDHGERGQQGQRIGDTCATLEMAETNLRKEMTLIDEGRWLEKKHQSKERLDQFSERYLTWCVTIVQKDWRSKKQRMAVIVEKLGKETLLGKITRADIEKYQAERLATLSRYSRPLNPATVNRELAVLKHMFTKANAIFSPLAETQKVSS